MASLKSHATGASSRPPTNAQIFTTLVDTDDNVDAMFPVPRDSVIGDPKHVALIVGG